jgi:Ca2+-binding EF-hand superfamily protein
MFLTNRITLVTVKYTKTSQETLDSLIFDLFDLNGNNLVTVQEMQQMLLTLPEQAIIRSILKPSKTATYNSASTLSNSTFPM